MVEINKILNFEVSISGAIMLLSLFFLFSCEDKERQNNETKFIEKEISIQEDILEVLIEVRVKENDKFQLFYVIDSLDGSFNAMDRVAVSVKGRKDFQSVQFKLPLTAHPFKFRIDCGENGIETPIEIKSLTIKFNGNEISIKEDVLFRVLKPNIYLEKLTSNSYQRKRVNNKYDPFFLSTSLLNKMMELQL